MLTPLKYIQRPYNLSRYHILYAALLSLSLFLFVLEFRGDMWPNESYYRTVLSATNKNSMLYTLETFTRLLDANNVTYIMCGGTLIGSYRHHGFIPWDDDVDLMINGTQKHTLQAAVKKLQPTFQLFTKGDPLGKPGWKFYRNTGHGFLHKSFKWPYIDIFFFQENDTHIWDKSYFDTAYQKSVIFPLVRRPFESLWLWSPCNPNLFLRKNYNLNQCQSPKFSHSRELPIIGFSHVVPCEQLAHLFPFVHRSTTFNGVNESLRIAGWSVRTHIAQECYQDDDKHSIARPWGKI